MPEIFECGECGARERAADAALLVHPDVRLAIRLQGEAFWSAHAGCVERVSRAARRLDALDHSIRRQQALGR